MNPRNGLLAIIMMLGGGLAGAAARAEDSTTPPRTSAEELAKFADVVIDKSLARVAEATDIAVVQVGEIEKLADQAAKRDHAARQQVEVEIRKLQAALPETREKPLDAEAQALAQRLAAKKQELAGILLGEREQLASDILELLYPDQRGVFQEAYEAGLGPADGAVRRKARARMAQIFGHIEPTATERQSITMALMTYLATTQEPQAALEASYQGRLTDPAVAEEYRQKQEAFWRPIRARTVEIAKALLPQDRQQEVDKEWNRRQERRISMACKELNHEFVGQTAEQNKQVEAAQAAFRVAAKAIDFDSSDYDVAKEALRAELRRIVNADR